LVVTTQRGLTDRAAVERFETVLAAGQSAAISIPRGAGEAPVRVVISNAGDPRSRRFGLKIRPRSA
jgi:hypothetical protein